MTDPAALGLDYAAMIEGETIIGWLRAGSPASELAPTPPGQPPRGYWVYASDGVTVIGTTGMRGGIDPL